MISHPAKEVRWVNSNFDFPLDDDISLADRIMVQEHIESGCLHWIDAIASGEHRLAGLDTAVLPSLFEARLNECRRVLSELRACQNA